VVPWRGAQVLSDRQQVATSRSEVLHRLADLDSVLAEAENQVRLGDQACRTGLGQHVERPHVAEARADALEDPWNGLHVVSEHFGARVENLGEKFRISGEVRDE